MHHASIAAKTQLVPCSLLQHTLEAKPFIVIIALLRLETTSKIIESKHQITPWNQSHKYCDEIQVVEQISKCSGKVLC